MTNAVFAKEVLRALQEALPARGSFTGLHEPEFSGNEWRYVKECLDTGWVSSAGKFVDQFEEQLREITGVKSAIAVVNGTAALHISLLLASVERGDEVLMPTLTFVATANAISYCGAVPHFVDSEERTLGLDPQKLDAYLREIAEVRGNSCYNKKSGRPMKAVVPMHTFGHPVDLDPLLEVCGRYKLVLVEDAAESLGSFYKGTHTGNLGRVSALSFNGNKTITTGGGGAILTNDEALGRAARHLTTTAKVSHRWEFYHDVVGYNYRMPNINAALGCAQLEQLSMFLRKKRALAKRYSELFAEMDGVTFFEEPEFATSNYWLNALLLDKPLSLHRDNILELANREGIMSRPVWKLMHKLPMFCDSPCMDLSVAESLESRLINIPSSPILAAAEDL